MADFKVAGAKHIEGYEPANKVQEAGMIVTSRVLFFGAFLLPGKPQVGGVAVAETRATTEVSVQVANDSRSVSSAVAEARATESTPATSPYVRPSGATTPV